MDEEQRTLALMPVMTMRAVMERRDAVVAFTRKAMKRGTDYGVIPGTGDKPTLLKPGAEKLCTLFGLSAKFSLTDRVEDWYGNDHGGEPMFYYIYKCSLYHGDWLVAEGEGSCNSHEKKYRYRSGERICPKCGKANIRKSKQGSGWYCWAKLGGCGETFKAGDASIESQNVGQVINPDIADQVNTIQKMAQKRALIAATLLAVNASEFFTQDLDDMVIEGEYTKDTGPKWPAEPATPEPPEPAGNGNGEAAAETTAPVPQSNDAIEWPTNLLNQLVRHYKGGNIHEYRARLSKSTVIKPDDKFNVVTHWMDIYNTERTAGIEPDEAARRADADRQATQESA